MDSEFVSIAGLRAEDKITPDRVQMADGLTQESCGLVPSAGIRIGSFRDH
jgi:hypothetical protein